MSDEVEELEFEGEYTVYMHITPNDKYYIGLTSTSLRERWGKDGYNYRKQLFGKAIKKYGWDNIEHITVIEGVSKDGSQMLEEMLMIEFDSTNPKKGYNVVIGGLGANGYKHTEDAIKRMTEKRSGELNYQYGKPLPEETKRKLSEAQKGKYEGVRNPASKLTNEDVVEIRKIYVKGDLEFGIIPLSKKYNVSQGTIGGIVRGQKWKHLL